MSSIFGRTKVALVNEMWLVAKSSVVNVYSSLSTVAVTSDVPDWTKSISL